MLEGVIDVVSMAFVINVIKWLLWTVETILIKWNPFFISTVTKKLSLASISWATVSISHPEMGHIVARQLSSKRETLTNAGPILAHRLRRWPSIKPALVQRLAFAGLRVWQWILLAASTSLH